jgi:four helix bundle protein
MTHRELYDRLARFADEISALARPLFDRLDTRSIADQLVRAADGAAANYRAANHGRSNAEFRAKLGVALEEIDEATHWLLRIERRKLHPLTAEVERLLRESLELGRILGASKRTANRNAERHRRARKKYRRRRRPDSGPDPRDTR